MLRVRDDQWDRIRERFPEEHIPEGRPGRKPVPKAAPAASRCRPELSWKPCCGF